jgi:DNA-binding LytR/AlgR family response regulator
LGVFGVTGFDAKASMAILLPCLVAILVSLVGATPSEHRRLIYAAVFSVFIAANILDPGFFLDAAYFAILAAAIWILSAFQAVAFVNAIKENERGDHVRRRLEHLLARKSDLQTPPLVVRHSGRMERFPMDDIIALEAAGDYVSLHVGSGRKVLANASLTALESELPDNFIRVHRSFLVNADKIVSLKRLPQGTGELVLTAGTTIPVSRRILPQLRKSLQSE